MAQYLDLVNEALRESGSTLDQLTSGTFTSPSDPLYTKFKQWVAQAWEDIQTDRRDWQFMQNTGVYLACPRMEVFGGSSNAVSDYNGASFSVNSTSNPDVITARSTAFLVYNSPAFTIESGTLALGTAEGYIDIASFSTSFSTVEPGDFLIAELGGEATASMEFRRWGRYDLQQTTVSASGYDSITDVSEIKLDSVAISDADQTTDNGYLTYSKLKYVPLSDWVRYGYNCPRVVGKPHSFTTSNNGKYEFYPPLDAIYNVFFEYTRTPQTLSAYNDTPTGLPARFHKAIAWRALMYYGEYDGISRIYNIAKNRYSKFEYEMVRDLLPEVTIGYDARRF